MKWTIQFYKWNIFSRFSFFTLVFVCTWNLLISISNRKNDRAKGREKTEIFFSEAMNWNENVTKCPSIFVMQSYYLIANNVLKNDCFLQFFFSSSKEISWKRNEKRNLCSILRCKSLGGFFAWLKSTPKNMLTKRQKHKEKQNITKIGQPTLVFPFIFLPNS